MLLVSVLCGLVGTATVVAASQIGGTDWQKYVRAPSSSIVQPKSILSTETKGDVANPNGLVDGSAVTVLTRGNINDDIPSLVVDFGQNVVGTLSIDFAGSVNASDSFPGLKLAFSETQEYLTELSDFTRSNNGAGSDVLTPGTDQVQVLNDPFIWKDLIGCKNQGNVCSDGLHGFRYVRISLDAYDGDAPDVSPVGTVSINSVTLDWKAYLGTPDTFTGYFECSDEDLTQWWYDGVYTADMGTYTFLANETDPRGSASPTLEGKEVLFDGAKRDRDPYVGDMAVASRTSYLSHDVSIASLNILEDLAQHQRSDGWIPPASINNYTLPLFDYPLWWVVASIDYVLYTGNTSYINTYWTNLVNVLDKYYPPNINPTTGVMEKAASLGYGDYAFLPRSGPITYYNALYVYAMKYTAQVATSIDRHDDASRWLSRAADISTALVTQNFDANVGAFYDGGPCPNAAADTVCDVHAQDGNSVAVLAGITNGNETNSLLDYYAKAASRPYGNAFYDSSVLSPGDQFDQRVYAFISYFELAARFQTPGQEASAFDQIRRMYGWMASQDPMITMWEGIGPNGSKYEQGFTSLSHGWSTGIVPLLSNYVLGVTPVEPGFSSWLVCPVMGGGVTWAKGTVPTPNGGIDVSWTTDNSILTIQINAPASSTGKVCIGQDGFNAYKVVLNGVDVTADSSIVIQK